MITRGYLIGEIVDYLSGIQVEVENRCSIGLTDLNKFLEDFFKEILNITLSSSLRNLNENRSNEPGIDLGDEGNSFAFQITSQKTKQKIDSTLKTLSEEQINKYQNIIIFIIGKKQNSYTEDKKTLEKVQLYT